MAIIPLGDSGLFNPSSFIFFCISLFLRDDSLRNALHFRNLRPSSPSKKIMPKTLP